MNQVPSQLWREDKNEVRLKVVAVRVMLVIVTTFGGVWAIFDLMNPAKFWVGIAELSCLVIGMVVLSLLSRTEESRRLSFIRSAFTLLPIGILLVNFFIVLHHPLGLGHSSIFWLFLIPPAVFFLAGLKIGLSWSVFIFFWMTGFYLLSRWSILGAFVSFEFFTDVLVAFVAVVGFIYLYERVRVEVLSDLRKAVLQDRAVLNTIRDGIIVVNEDKEIQVCNQAVAEILGWSMSEIFSHGLGEILRRDDQRALDVFVFLDKEEEVSLLTKMGGVIHVNMTVSLVESNRSDNLIGGKSFVIRMHDVTEERELHRMKLDFVAMAAHELRTPLTSMMGYLSILEEEVSVNLKPEYRQFLFRSLTSGKRLLGLMENLLSITKIEKGHLSIETGPVDWLSLIKERVEGAQALARDKGITLDFILPEENIPYVRADTLRIREVVNNLIDNAVKYTREGGVQVWLENDREKGVVITHVKDSGIGIPRESLPHMFEKFYRVSGALEEGSKGTGLGLFISKSLVEMHGGRIWVESVLNQGSTFSFSLPVFRPGEDEE